MTFRKPEWTPEQREHIDAYAKRSAAIDNADPWAYHRAKRDMLMGWAFPSDFRTALEAREKQRAQEIRERVSSAYGMARHA